MLTELRIRGLGVIDDAELSLHPGLTVLTGETGAGKTMIVHGLGLLLGARADTVLVRDGAPAASVEGIVRVGPDHPALARTVEAGGEVDGNELVLVRSVSREGRSRAHVGGRSTPVGVLSEIGETLVAVHGQADQWRLRRPDQHREVVDAYGGGRVLAARAAYEQAYAQHRQMSAEITRLRGLDRDRQGELDALVAELEQIERVAPQPGEDEVLRIESERLGHVETLRLVAHEAHSILSAADDPGAPNVTELLTRVRQALDTAADHDPTALALRDRARELTFLAADLGGDVAAYLADLDGDPARLETIHQRRADLSALTRRRGGSVDALLAWSQEAAQRVADITGADDRLALLEQQLPALTAALTAAADRLSDERARAAKGFGAAVTAELRHLAMGSAAVKVIVAPRDPGPDGADDIEIQLASATGERARSVSKGASGGELSRLMLAIEVVSARDGEGAMTFVFDEVDAGVGGRAAVDVGARLAALARHHQVIVVTHLAQVAAYADRHLVVRKDPDGSVSAVAEVSGADRVAEIARMMGGGSTAAGLTHAQELLHEAATRRG